MNVTPDHPRGNLARNTAASLSSARSVEMLIIAVSKSRDRGGFHYFGLTNQGQLRELVMLSPEGQTWRRWTPNQPEPLLKGNIYNIQVRLHFTYFVPFRPAFCLTKKMDSS